MYSPLGVVVAVAYSVIGMTEEYCPMHPQRYMPCDICTGVDEYAVANDYPFIKSACDNEAVDILCAAAPRIGIVAD